MVSVIIGLGLAAYYSWDAYTHPRFDFWIHFVLVVLVLLNARQNLRQYNYAKILENTPPDAPHRAEIADGDLVEDATTPPGNRLQELRVTHELISQV